jgi:hypothetical protein
MRRRLRSHLDWSVALRLPEQLWEPGDFDRYAARLVVRQHFGLARFVFVFPRVE